MNHRMVRLGSAVALLIAVVLTVSTPARAQGAGALYKAKCSLCHADDGSSSGATGKQLGAKDLRSDEVQKQTDAQLTANIANGVGKKMPAFKGKLTDAQIKDLVGYIRGLAKKS
jgi:mono/diheme cytochrome c family protein